MSNIVSNAPLPRLVLLDNTDRQKARSGVTSEIQFKFNPTNFAYDRGAAWASSTGMNRNQPILQYSHGNQNGYKFNMRLFAMHKDDDIQAQLSALEASVEKDEDLKRPPRWQFIWGQFIDETVVVQSIGGVQIADGGLRPDGTLRDVTCAIDLLIYRSVDVAIVAEDRPTDTFYAVTKRGDTWEDIALREYDEPAYGELLRRRNPSIMFPGQQPGKIVKLPKIENLRGLTIEPDSIPLRRTAEGLALRAKMWAARSKSRESTVMKK